MGVFPERKKRERGASQEGAIHTLQTENENETANNGRDVLRTKNGQKNALLRFLPLKRFDIMIEPIEPSS